MHIDNVKAMRNVCKETCVTYLALRFSKLIRSWNSLFAKTRVDNLYRELLVYPLPTGCLQ